MMGSIASFWAKQSPPAVYAGSDVTTRKSKKFKKRRDVHEATDVNFTFIGRIYAGHLERMQNAESKAGLSILVRYTLCLSTFCTTVQYTE